MNINDYQDQVAALLANAQRIKEIKPYKRPKKDYLETTFKYKMQLDYRKSMTRDNPKGNLDLNGDSLNKKKTTL